MHESSPLKTPPDRPFVGHISSCVSDPALPVVDAATLPLTFQLAPTFLRINVQPPGRDVFSACLDTGSSVLLSPRPHCNSSNTTSCQATWSFGQPALQLRFKVAPCLFFWCPVRLKPKLAYTCGVTSSSTSPLVLFSEWISFSGTASFTTLLKASSPSNPVVSAPRPSRE